MGDIFKNNGVLQGRLRAVACAPDSFGPRLPCPHHDQGLRELAWGTRPHSHRVRHQPETPSARECCPIVCMAAKEVSAPKAPGNPWMVPGDVAMGGHCVGALAKLGHPSPQTGHCRGGSTRVTWSSVSCCRGCLATVCVMIARGPSTCHFAKGRSPARGFLSQARGPAGTRPPQHRCSSHEA
ncbi:putative uncharacterized protein KIF25-AS1 [Pongo abelii]|uniref:putative uncharacterized protein KIF25-AS1 n=1 Tax=Pongo abelii TaxID=9601 RepID=UPI0023E8145D|nr:putative uncharacterized protein KIF25-AS1 [Pongo abelii]